MRARTRSLIDAMAAGALLGALALAVRLAPTRASSAAPPASSPPRPSSDPAPYPPSASSAPAALAACAEDMALVDGDFCPALSYDCGRQTGAVGCAEYLR